MSQVIQHHRKYKHNTAVAALLDEDMQRRATEERKSAVKVVKVNVGKEDIQ